MRLRRLLSPLCALALAGPLALPLAGCLGSSDLTEPVASATVETTTFDPSLGVDITAAGWTRTSLGLYHRTVTPGAESAATVANGQQVTIRYKLWLSTGAAVDSSASYGPFTLGAGALIPGVELGVAGMRVGEQRRILIPPTLGYGPQGYLAVPGNAVLVFDVEVLSAT